MRTKAVQSRSEVKNAASQAVVIYGIKGFSREVHQLVKDVAAAGGPIACTGFLVDPKYREGSVIDGLPVFGDVSGLTQAPDALVTIAIGATAPRRRIARAIENQFGPRFVTLRHPRACIGDSVSVGAGSILCAGGVAMADITIGAHVQLHVNCTIGHDTVISDFVTIAPGANVSGRVEIGEGTFVGTGAVILPDIKVGAWSVIGAGAVVTKDVPDNVIVVGIPATLMDARAPGWQLENA
jgi:sugar O-acyltransferase (sialic acid O-acetyltransferase NeuD family)